MKFLIRDVFIITFFIAISAFYFSAERRLALLNAQLASQERQNSEAYLVNSRLTPQRDFLHASIDRCLQIEDTAKQLESQFPALQAKYALVQPSDESTTSLRQIPMLIDRQTGADLSRIRMHVPGKRPLFLKYGITLSQPPVPIKRKTKRLGDSHSPIAESVGHHNTAPRELRLLFGEDGFAARETLPMDSLEPLGTNCQTTTDYSEAGPFELQLPSGLVDIDWSNSLNPQGLWETRLSLNQRTLVTAVYRWNAPCNSHSTLWASSQLDLAVGDRLPVLFSSMCLPTESAKLRPPFEIRVWLDETSSGFRAFPEAGDLK